MSDELGPAEREKVLEALADQKWCEKHQAWCESNSGCMACNIEATQFGITMTFDGLFARNVE